MPESVSETSSCLFSMTCSWISGYKGFIAIRGRFLLYPVNIWVRDLWHYLDSTQIFENCVPQPNFQSPRSFVARYEYKMLLDSHQTWSEQCTSLALCSDGITVTHASHTEHQVRSRQTICATFKVLIIPGVSALILSPSLLARTHKNKSPWSTQSSFVITRRTS